MPSKSLSNIFQKRFSSENSHFDKFPLFVDYFVSFLSNYIIVLWVSFLLQYFLVLEASDVVQNFLISLNTIILGKMVIIYGQYRTVYFVYGKAFWG